MKLGEVIKRLRIENGLSQKALADKIGKTPHLISAIERGVVTPSIETLTDIARVFSMSVSEIFLESEESLTENPNITVLMSQVGKLSKEDQAAVIEVLSNYIKAKRSLKRKK
jgi:transcriptional regulator with XRE-family HTH domain